ncbi:hypothetical protein QQS45_09185 [Alteriqipengyuania flavescens]|uniref:hypothetical protein n=1 Tax=Alteriqipengyuania flavescens TaxID=3053610 RepID=UPI0025B50ED9|nr:hypothetical protein [Alteriqipengyuania flavescens]WJY17811.1 hypothetical protein QQW98_09180 [Alteriqipengyuania flavescens]WJY23753.1 hypothetical protein QQS45_09185 [Alteriqipengyuania flavescens]
MNAINFRPERPADMFTQLVTPLPVHVIDRGPGLAFAVIDYGIEHNLIWVTALDATGEIWCAPNPKVRVADNWTAGRTREPEASARRQKSQENKQ